MRRGAHRSALDGARRMVEAYHGRLTIGPAGMFGMEDHSDNAAKAVPIKCTACERTLESPLFCDSCRRLYPADGLNFFELLGIRPTYDIDAEAVRNKYFTLMRGLHPDRMAAGPADVQRLCLRINARINEAYNILMDPVLRAEYLLEIYGGKSAADDKHVPQEVLTESLELREQIDEALVGGDRTALERLRIRIRERFDTAAAEIARLARVLPGTDSDRKSLRGHLNAVRYFRKILEQLEVGTV